MLHLLATIYADDATRTILWHALSSLHLDGIAAQLIHLAGFHLFEDWSIGR